MHKLYMYISLFVSLSLFIKKIVEGMIFFSLFDPDISDRNRKDSNSVYDTFIRHGVLHSLYDYYERIKSMYDFYVRFISTCHIMIDYNRLTHGRVHV